MLLSTTANTILLAIRICSSWPRMVAVVDKNRVAWDCHR